jgi:hypothetical protein
MKEFAQIETDPTNQARKYVHWRFNAEANPYPAIVPIVEVTNIDPLPKEGWTANEDGTYSEPEFEERPE